MSGVLKFLPPIIWLLVICTGLYDLLTNYEDNRCEMTYMFKYPQYLKVKLSKRVQAKFPNYGLYFYDEAGDYTGEKGAFNLHGIPVLFIPGNAGSHRQVRSLGSVSLWRARDKMETFHFNYFSIDFNEELSALGGSLLMKETEFVHHSLKKILLLYKKARDPPKSVLLVGHSMGGIVARALFTLPDFNPTIVHTIITQATPHQAPVVTPDYATREFYDKVNNYWVEHANSTISHVTVASTGGGYRDLLVRSGLTSLDGVVANSRAVSSNTMAVPKAWVATDHKCHIWCKQFALATVRAIIDIVDPETRQISEDIDLKMKVFNHHFVRHPGTKKFKREFEETIVLSHDRGVWEERTEPAWNYQRKVTKPTYIAVPVQSDKYVVAVTDVETYNWIGGCKSRDGQKCSKVVNLSHLGRMIPPNELSRKTVHLTSSQLKDFTHIVFILNRQEKEVQLTVEMYDPDQRHFNVTLPGFFTEFPRTSLKWSTVIPKTPSGAVFYNISVPYLETVRQAYRARLVPLKCEGKYKGGMMQMHVPWANEDTSAYGRAMDPFNLTMKFQTGMPSGWSILPQLHLYLDPGCEYELEVGLSLPEFFGQFMRFYGPLIPGMMVSQFLLVLSWQLMQLSKQDGEDISYLKAYTDGTFPKRVLPFIMFPSLIMGYEQVQTFLFETLRLPLPDGPLLEKRGIWNTGLYPNVFFMTNAFAMAAGLLLYGYMLFIGKVYGFCLKRWVSSERFQRVFTVLQYCYYVAGVVVAFWTCGTLGLGLLVIIQMIHVKVLSMQLSGGDETKKRSFNLHFILLLLYVLMFCLNMSPLILWAKTFRQEITLIDDTSRLPSIVMCLAVIIITYCDKAGSLRDFPTVSLKLIHAVAILIAFYGMESVYRVPYFLCAVFIVMASSGLYRKLAGPVPVKITEEEKKTQ